MADHLTSQLPNTQQYPAANRSSVAHWVTMIESRPYLLPALLLLIGAAWRIWWAQRHLDPEIWGEAGRAAVAFARTGAIADPFYPGEGPTAHLSPVAPIINGFVLRILGVETVQSTWALTVFAIACCLGAALILYHAFGIMGASRRSRLMALALACLLPINPYLEMQAFRFWEGGIAVLLSAFILWLTVRADDKGEVDFPQIAVLSFLLALLFFINLALGLAGYANLALLLLRRVPMRRWIPAMAAAAVILVAVLTPWTIRNYAVFGRFIPLRGNAGLELALANHPAAVSGENPKVVFRARLAEIHPDDEPEVFRKMQLEGGAIPYSERLGRETTAWIRQHPADFARLSLRHAREFFFPPRWFWTTYAKRERAIDIKQQIMLATAFFGLFGVAACLFWWRNRMLYAVAIAIVPVLPYMVVQPTLRYRYIVLFPLLYLSIVFIDRIWLLCQVKRSKNAIPLGALQQLDQS